MVDFNPDTQYVVRNKRISFDIPEDQKSSTEKVINIYFMFADKSKTKVEKYDAFGIKDSGEKTTYYDAAGNEIGSVFKFADNGERRTNIHMTEADYWDYDSNGTIDAKDTDRVYDKATVEAERNGRKQLIESILSKYNYKSSDLKNPDVLAKIIRENPQISPFALDEYVDSLSSDLLSVLNSNSSMDTNEKSILKNNIFNN